MRWPNPVARLLGRRAWPPPLPTADYYLLGGFRDATADAAGSGRGLVRVAPHAWARDDRLVIVRYAGEPEIDLLASRRWRTLHYVIDDLVTSAQTSAELPPDYRLRLARFAREHLPRILEAGPVVVAPSRNILAAFPGHGHRLLDPCCLAMADGAPLPSPPAWEGPLRLVFLGTRSHEGSLPLLGAIAEAVAARIPGSRLHLFFGRHLPGALARSPAIANHEPIPWAGYAAYCRRHRFHAGLAPVQATPFAMARSITKVMDHAAVGAAGLYSARPPFEGVVSNMVDGLLVGDDPADWSEAIAALAQSPPRAAELARGGMALAANRGDPRRVRRFWLSEWGFDDGDCDQALA